MNNVSPTRYALDCTFCRRVFAQYNAREAAERDPESIFDGCLSYSPHTRPFALVGGRERAAARAGRRSGEWSCSTYARVYHLMCLFNLFI